MNRALAVALGLGLAASSQAGRAPAAVETVDAAHVEALLINGGGTPAANYRSHLMHVRLMLDILREAGVPERRITILSGDGPDPAADVALREVQREEDYWLLTGTRLEQSAPPGAGDPRPIQDHGYDLGPIYLASGA